MTAVYTWDVFSTLDGYGSYAERATGAATGASRAPSCSTTRLALFDTEQRMVFGATTFRETARILASGTDPNALTSGTSGRCAAGDGDLVHVARHPRLAGRDHS